MKKIIAVLDTNVIMENPFILNSLSNYIVVLTTTVLSELDKHKSGLDEVNRNVREFVRQIPLTKTSVKYFNSEKLSDTNDMCIIEACVKLSNKHIVLLYTNDLLMSALAKTKQIKTVKFDSNSNQSNDIFYTGLSDEKDQDLLDYTKNLNQYIKMNDGLIYKKTKHGLSKLPMDFSVMGISHKNLEQRCAIDALTDDSIKLVTLSGSAGSGKTLMSLAAGLEMVLNGEDYDVHYRKLMVARPIIPMGKDLGYLPGSEQEKLAPWMMPIVDNIEQVMDDGRPGGFEKLQTQGIVKIEALTYIRGRSISNTFIIIDEAQNLSKLEIETIITRVGDKTKIVLTGDINQIDNPKLDSMNNGLSSTIQAFRDEKIAAHIHFSKCERSELAEVATKVFRKK